MPLLSEFPSYSEWGEEDRRWAKTLYNHPISSVIDYFVVNFIASTNRIDNESGGRLKYKLRAKVEQNEEEIKNGSVFESITTEWMFSTLKARHYEPSGQPITRITTKLNELNKVIWRIGDRSKNARRGLGLDRKEKKGVGNLGYRIGKPGSF